METTQVISKRRSIRAYKSEQISTQELEKILLAGSASPVGRGNYAGLHITVIQTKEIIKKSETVKKTMKSDIDPIYGAPMLVIVSS